MASFIERRKPTSHTAITLAVMFGAGVAFALVSGGVPTWQNHGAEAGPGMVWRSDAPGMYGTLTMVYAAVAALASFFACYRFPWVTITHIRLLFLSTFFLGVALLLYSRMLPTDEERAQSAGQGVEAPGGPSISADQLDPATEKQIRDLIDQLASKNSPPSGKGWPGLDHPDDWNEKNQETVYEARKKLRDFGKSAFPILIEYLDDDRYSLTAEYSIEVNHSVGEVCGHIIEGNVRLIGMRYKSRTGADGKSQMCPDYLSANYGGDLKRWWRDNRRKTLRQMQLDVLRWRIAEEERLGFPPEESDWGNKYMTELRDKLKEIDAAQ